MCADLEDATNFGARRSFWQGWWNQLVAKMANGEFDRAIAEFESIAALSWTDSATPY
jgi:hypothetical protein